MVKRCEAWRPVIGYEGAYSVSDQGRVRTERRVFIRSNGRKYTVKERILKTGLKAKHYPSVNLSQTNYYVHHLVAAAFLGKRPEGVTLIRHLDDDPNNNKASNLSWGTKTDNGRDSVRNKKWRNQHV